METNIERHQRYCSAPRCRRAGKAASQARWLGKPENQRYFRDPWHAARVHAWRSRNPGYWRRVQRRAIALQDVSTAQPVDAARKTDNFARSPRKILAAVDIVNTLAAAQSAGRLKREIGRYLKPGLLIIDELGYLPIDKYGADLLFQIIRQRYERAPLVITTNRAYKHWSQIFNNDSTLTSAILDRVLRHVDTVLIEGKGFRTKTEIAD